MDNYKVFRGILFAAFIFIIVFIIIYAIQVFLLIFASILFAIFLRTISNQLLNRIKISDTVSIFIVLISLLFILIAVGFLLAPAISNQIGKLVNQLPEAWSQFSKNLENFINGEPLTSPSNGINFTNIIFKNIDAFFKSTFFVSATFGFIGSFVIFIFMGIFFALNPKIYKDSFIRLLPIKKRKRANEILTEIDETLSWWLIGKLLAMLIVGFLTSLGLWILGMPLPFALGLVAAILTFIPNIGPFLSAIPAVLIAASQNSMLMLYVIILYIVIQTIESYLITPNILKRTINLPPAGTLSIQLLMGILTGGLGLALATPLAAIIIVVVKMLYVEDVIND